MYLDNPSWCSLFATKDPFGTDDTSSWINRTVYDIDSHNMRAVWVGILVPHPNDNMCP